jgi:hypothetical protein
VVDTIIEGRYKMPKKGSKSEASSKKGSTTKKSSKKVTENNATEITLKLRDVVWDAVFKQELVDAELASITTNTVLDAVQKANVIASHVTSTESGALDTVQKASAIDTHLTSTEDSSSSCYITPLLGNYVVVRADDAGVHAGVLKELNKDTVVLTDSRRIWRWTGANTLNEVAGFGVTSAEKSKYTRVSDPIEEIVIARWCEVIKCTDKARKLIVDAGWAE